MELLREEKISCPYCGEPITVVIDISVPEQDYVEDCQVCCQPIRFLTRNYPGETAQLEARREDDA